MRQERDRDQSVERMLRRALRASEPVETGPACLEAEMLAAWMDGSLAPGERAAVEAHAAGCARCQAMLAAMARTTPPPVAPARSWRRRLLPVLVPLTAATALVIWVAVPKDEYSRPADVREEAKLAAGQDRVLPQAPALEAEGRGPGVGGAPAARAERVPREAQAREGGAPRAEAKAAGGGRQEAGGRRQEAEREKSNIARVPTEAVAPPRTPEAREPLTITTTASPMVAGRAGGLRDEVASLVFEIRSPDSQRRWRVVADRVERSTDGGVTWIAQNVASPTALTAGASPAPDVCWLVGRAGTVLLSTDGQTWQRVRFPEAVDLVAVSAIDATTATVVAADGRSYITKNGGLTWDRVPPG